MTFTKLSDSQIAELAEMGVAGRMMAESLRLWRKVEDGPWEPDFRCVECESPEGGEHWCSYDELAHRLVAGECKMYGLSDSAEFREDDTGRAIAHTRNTIELQAAALYHQEKLRFYQARLSENSPMKHHDAKAREVWRHADDKCIEIESSLSAISAELAKGEG